MVLKEEQFCSLGVKSDDIQTYLEWPQLRKGMLLSSKEQKPGTLLNIEQCTGQPSSPAGKNYLAPHTGSSETQKPCLSAYHSLCLVCSCPFSSLSWVSVTHIRPSWDVISSRKLFLIPPSGAGCPTSVLPHTAYLAFHCYCSCIVLFMNQRLPLGRKPYSICLCISCS